MSLPELIEIIPLTHPVRAEITVPGSKSITNRALILAALADGEVTLTGALWSEDTQVMTEALRTLGFDVQVEDDPAEFCNRTITVKGQGGKIPNTGTAEKPLELFVGNAGTAARFLAAMVCLGNGVYRLSGVPRMHERPQAALFKALRELGYRVDSPNYKLPATIFGRSSRGNEAHSEKGSKSLLTSAATNEGLRSCTVSIEESSQFASALLLSAKNGGWDVKVAGDDDEEAPYVTMTERLVEVFPWGGGEFHIELDASSGSYLFGAAMMSPGLKQIYLLPNRQIGLKSESEVVVKNWPTSGWQFDEAFPQHLILDDGMLHAKELSRNRDLGDSIMTAMVLAAYWGAIKFTDLSRLRVQECERVEAMRKELSKLVCEPETSVIEIGETLTIQNCRFHQKPTEIETYKDHRMAMCFAILGLKVPGVKLKNPACVKKTFPNFFQKLAAPPPNGLGVEIRDGHTGRKLEMDELFAE